MNVLNSVQYIDVQIPPYSNILSSTSNLKCNKPNTNKVQFITCKFRFISMSLFSTQFFSNAKMKQSKLHFLRNSFRWCWSIDCLNNVLSNIVKNLEIPKYDELYLKMNSHSTLKAILNYRNHSSVIFHCTFL